MRGTVSPRETHHKLGFHSCLVRPSIRRSASSGTRRSSPSAPSSARRSSSSGQPSSPPRRPSASRPYPRRPPVHRRRLARGHRLLGLGHPCLARLPPPLLATV